MMPKSSLLGRKPRPYVECKNVFKSNMKKKKYIPAADGLGNSYDIVKVTDVEQHSCDKTKSDVTIGLLEKQVENKKENFASNSSENSLTRLKHSKICVQVATGNQQINITGNMMKDIKTTVVRDDKELPVGLLNGTAINHTSPLLKEVEVKKCFVLTYRLDDLLTMYNAEGSKRRKKGNRCSKK